MTTTMYDISAYSRGGSFMNLNIIRPIPSTTKLDINVKVLRKLLSLSLRLREHVRDGTKLICEICRLAHPTLNKAGNIV